MNNVLMLGALLSFYQKSMSNSHSLSLSVVLLSFHSLRLLPFFLTPKFNLTKALFIASCCFSQQVSTIKVFRIPLPKNKYIETWNNKLHPYQL